MTESNDIHTIHVFDPPRRPPVYLTDDRVIQCSIVFHQDDTGLDRKSVV